MTGENNPPPAKLAYEARRTMPASDQPYRTPVTIPLGLICTVVGFLLSAGSVLSLGDFIRYGQDSFELGTGLMLGMSGVPLFVYGPFVLWMNGRALSGYRTYSAWRVLGWVIRWLSSIIDGG